MRFEFGDWPLRALRAGLRKLGFGQNLGLLCTSTLNERMISENERPAERENALVLVPLTSFLLEGLLADRLISVRGWWDLFCL